eukprot:2806779-Karenia_brevis.AAC.1
MVRRRTWKQHQAWKLERHGNTPGSDELKGVGSSTDSGALQDTFSGGRDSCAHKPTDVHLGEDSFAAQPSLATSRAAASKSGSSVYCSA